jgi:hypothetical protein
MDLPIRINANGSIIFNGETFSNSNNFIQAFEKNYDELCQNIRTQLEQIKELYDKSIIRKYDEVEAINILKWMGGTNDSLLFLHKIWNEVYFSPFICDTEVRKIFINDKDGYFIRLSTTNVKNLVIYLWNPLHHTLDKYLANVLNDTIVVGKTIIPFQNVDDYIRNTLYLKLYGVKLPESMRVTLFSNYHCYNDGDDDLEI